MAKTNCPNCGAPITGPACPYCGTEFVRPDSAIDLALGRKLSVSFEAHGYVYEFDMVLDRAEICSQASDCIFADDRLYRTVATPEYEAVLNGRIVPSEKHGHSGILFYRMLAPEEVTC